MDKPNLRFVHVSDANFDSISGIATVLPELIKYQNQIEHCESILITLKRNQKKFEFKSLQANSVLKFIKIIHTYKPNLIILHDLYSIKYVFFTLILILLNKPYVIVPHSCLTKQAQQKNKLKKIIANYTLWLPMLLFARALVFLNNNEKNNSIFNWKKNIIIPNGIDKINILPKMHITNNYIKLIFLGRLDVFHKGLDRLVIALSKIKTELRERNVTLEIYGNAVKQGKYLSAQAQQFKKLITSYRLENIIKIYNPIYGEEKYKILNNSDIMVLTSRYEGMPMSILEAFSFGLPVIITKETNMADIVNKFNAGWVLNDDLNNWSQDIIHFIDSYKLNKTFYINNSYKCAQNFLWSNISSYSIEQYKNLLS